jgi:hypothetical protein
MPATLVGTPANFRKTTAAAPNHSSILQGLFKKRGRQCTENPSELASPELECIAWRCWASLQPEFAYNPRPAPRRRDDLTGLFSEPIEREKAVMGEVLAGVQLSDLAISPVVNLAGETRGHPSWNLVHRSPAA